MRIFHYDRETGALIAEGLADPDQLDPTNWLVPAFATADVPPEAGPGEAAVFRDGAWTLEDVPVPPQPEPPSAEELLAQAWADLRAERDWRIGQRRWLIERHRDELELQRPTTLAAEQYAAELAYHQALRDLPETVTDPAAPEWPAAPF